MLFEALAKFGLPSESELFCGQVKDPLHTVAASITYGYSLHCIRLQPPLLTVAAPITYGCSLLFCGQVKDTLRCLECGFESVRSEAFSDVQVASITHGCSLHYTRLQPPLHTVTASITYGCSLHYTHGYSLHDVRL